MERLITSYLQGREWEKITNLCHVMHRYGSDKGLGWHNYTTFYDYIFKNKVNEELNVFELGLGTNNVNIPSNMGSNGKPGASIYGWREYFPKSNIYGADVDKDILFESERIKTYYCDQTKKEIIDAMWLNIDKKFDIIIEDGLHTFEANYIFLTNSLPYLKEGGIFICEDLSHQTMEQFRPLLGTFGSSVKSATLVAIPHSNTYDNNLLVIEKY